MQRLDDGQHFRPRDAVMDGRAVPPGLDQPVGPQSHELLRHRHLIDVEQLSQLGHRALLVSEGAQHEQTLWMGQAPEQFRCLA